MTEEELEASDMAANDPARYAQVTPSLTEEEAGTLVDIMCLWEAMLENHRNDRNDEQQVTRTWCDVGTYQMRYWCADLLGPLNAAWVIWNKKAKNADTIGFDWEFCPAFLREVEWTRKGPIADPERIAAIMLANEALGHNN